MAKTNEERETLMETGVGCHVCLSLFYFYDDNQKKQERLSLSIPKKE